MSTAIFELVEVKVRAREIEEGIADDDNEVEVGNIELDEVDADTVEVGMFEVLDLAMLMQDIGITSFGFSSLIRRLEGDLPRLVETELEI